ncbi:hypothetical protein WISP_124804 [Willisornis vidua]|uniref:Neutral ceramidase n=1 Tax=Willisornis vidua TaxID=1566151 RepID=A0ABQ9CXD5_9PASS|nr:hypothetical protein WISP_124804 [Willisornis vidua]
MELLEQVQRRPPSCRGDWSISLWGQAGRAGNVQPGEKVVWRPLSTFQGLMGLFGDWESHLRRIMKLIAGGGLSITGSHNMCGDYLYSGHTVILTLTYLFIREYSPRRLWWYHWLCWALSMVGMFCILLAHDHYTVDVVVAYYITTRLFWWYHTMANQQVLKEASQTNLLARVWWYKPFQYFEKNVQGIVPRSYHWPLRWPALPRRRPVKYSRVASDTRQLSALTVGLSSSWSQGIPVPKESPKDKPPQVPVLASFGVNLVHLSFFQCLTHRLIQQFPSQTFQLGTGLELGHIPLAAGTGEETQMGYANPDQVGGGLLTHLYSRAFIVADPADSRRVVFVSADIGMMSQRVRMEVLGRLKSKYGDLYRQDNVILSGTHTHSGPAGYFQYTLFWITSKGLIRPSLNAIVNGIVKSIDIAHENMKRGKLFINRGTVENSQINRSPFSYLANPESERSRYSSNTDKEMVILKMVDEDGQELGLISWFAVHPVSMNNTNRLVNSDNVGYASYLFEQEKNKGMLPGEGSFVAAFASSNLGDVSPNTRGPTCVNTGESCDNPQSTCPVGGATMCMAKGPGRDMFESTRIIGQNIYLKAKELYEKASQEVRGPLSTAHQWVNMSDVSVELNATHKVKTCKPALGHSFAAGTIDGVGAFNFTQGLSVLVRKQLQKDMTMP